MVDSRLRSAFRFFLEHAGYCSPPGRTNCAMALARAEQWAQDEGYTATWEYDDEGARDWYCECGCKPDEVLGCTLLDSDGEHAASLWSIGDPSRGYRRVVEAELASEAMHNAMDRIVDSVLQV
jgi:hypothetical protein